MSTTEYIRIALVKCGNISEAELARRLQTTPQNLHKKMLKDDWRESDLRAISNALNCKLNIRFLSNETNEEL